LLSLTILYAKLYINFVKKYINFIYKFYIIINYIINLVKKHINLIYEECVFMKSVVVIPEADSPLADNFLTRISPRIVVPGGYYTPYPPSVLGRVIVSTPPHTQRYWGAYGAVWSGVIVSIPPHTQQYQGGLLSLYLPIPVSIREGYCLYTSLYRAVLGIVSQITLSHIYRYQGWFGRRGGGGGQPLYPALFIPLRREAV